MWIYRGHNLLQAISTDKILITVCCFFIWGFCFSLFYVSVKIWKILNYLAFSSKPTHSCSQYWYMFVWSELINHKVSGTLDKVMFSGCLFQQNIKLIERTFVHFHVWSGVRWWWWWFVTWPQWARWKNNRKHFGRHLFSISFRCFSYFSVAFFQMLNFRGFFGFVSLCVCMLCNMVANVCLCVCLCGLCVKMKPSFSKNRFSRWVSSKKSFVCGRG